MKIADKILGEILLHKRGEYQWYINQKPGFKEPIIEAMESYHAQFTTQKQVTDDIKDINFIKWYSGMDESKIRNAYKRYIKESKTK